MIRKRTMTLLVSAAVLPLAVPALAACGASSATATTAPADAPSKAATVNAANRSLGRILVNPTGLTLYLFKADVGKTSRCAGACAAAWPPMLVNGKPTVGRSVSASFVGTTKRPDGATQVAYDGHPLYRFAEDQQPGDLKGQDVTALGAAWLVVSPSGNQGFQPAAEPGRQRKRRRQQWLLAA
jgi:predicted lipoprotein with Yx(FWY)xxD motif